MAVSECKFLTFWKDSRTFEILSHAPGWNEVNDNREVVLALTLQIHADQVKDLSAIEGFLNLLKLYWIGGEDNPAFLYCMLQV
jgi:hypothetical protein